LPINYLANRTVEDGPKETLAPDRIVGVDQVIAEAVSMKFLAAPPTPEQVKELIQIPQ
jgi:hypothetical protein